MTNEAMKKVLVKAGIFSFLSIALMLQRSATKHIMIADAAGVTVERSKSEDQYTLLLDRNISSGKEGKLIIPVPKSVGSDRIAVEDNYLEHELLVYIDSDEEGFYKDNPIKAGVDIIESALCVKENETGAVCLEFGLDGLYANQSTLTENSTIEVSFFKPYEKYDRIVVVDPIAGGTDRSLSGNGVYEKDVALDIALELKALSEKEENNDIKFYYTRLTDADVDFSKRSDLVRDTKADLLIGIGTIPDSDPELNGLQTRYNDSFFVRKLNNAQFADIVEKNTVEKAGANAIGMEVATEEDELLWSSTIPSCRVLVGNLENAEDVQYLSNGAYKNKIAAGIYSGISEAFDVMSGK